MTHTEQLIQDGLKGGFSPFLDLANNDLKCRLEGDLFVCTIKPGPNRDRPRGTCTVCVEKLLLQPEFWQAVYKVRGCPGTCNGDVRKPACGICGGWGSNKDPRPHMHRFIDHLADGKTIEEAAALT